MKNITIIFIFLSLFYIGFAQDTNSELNQTVKSTGVLKDLQNEPDGVTIRLFDNGEYQIFSVGSGVYNFNTPDDRVDAEKEAQLKAKANLSKFFNESITSNESFDEINSKMKMVSSSNGEEVTAIDKEYCKKICTSISSSSSALLKGVVTLSTINEPFSENAGTIKVLLGVSSKTLKVVSLANLEQNTFVNSDSEVSTSIDDSDTVNAADNNWINCIGEGKTRHEAVVNALIEGVSCVYGTSIAYDEKFSNRMNVFKANAFNFKVGVKEAEQNITSQTFGFVKEYRIVNVKKLNNGFVEVEVRALIINPRANNAKAIMIMPTIMDANKLTCSYEIGPNKCLSGSEITKATFDALNKIFVNTSKFIVLNSDGMINAINNSQLTADMVNAGLSPSSELMKTGQMLTADYMFTSKINDIKYTKKLMLNKDTKKFGPMYTMSINLDYAITDVVLGSSLVSDNITVKLDHNQIEKLIEEEEDLLYSILLEMVFEITNKLKK